MDRALRSGPVHVIRRNHPSYVILSEAQYRRLIGHEEAAERLWDRLLTEGPTGERSAADIDAQLETERGSWQRP